MKRTLTAYVFACSVAALVPLLPLTERDSDSGSPSDNTSIQFPGWPATFDGRPLKEEFMGSRERRFYKDFTGHVAKFTDGQRQIIIRWVGNNTRKFHLSRSCFRSAGYDLHPLPARADSDGKRWGGFSAHRQSDLLNVYERIEDCRGHQWTDESAWRWDLFWKTTRGPWWAYTVAEQALPQRTN